MIQKRILGVSTLLAAVLLAGCSDNGNDTPHLSNPSNSGSMNVVAPVAVADAFSGVESSQITGSVLANDTVNGATISAHTVPGHGSVSLNADGSFAYVPTASYAGSDSFTYTLTNSAGSSTATVTLTITAGGVHYYVNNQAPTSGDGSQATPFESLAQATAALANVQGGQIIVMQGDGTSRGLDSPVTLTSGQSLVGFSSAAPPTLTGPIVLTGSSNSVQNVRVYTNSNYPVNATGASNASLVNVTVANATLAAVTLANCTGNFSLSGVTLSNNQFVGLLAAATSGNLSLSVQNSSITNSSLGIFGVSQGTSNQTLTVSGTTFVGGSFQSEAPPSCILLESVGNGTLTADVTNSTLAAYSQGLYLYGSDNGYLASRFIGDTISGGQGAVAASFSSNSTAKLRFENNLATDSGAAGSGFDIVSSGGGQIYSTFTNNTSGQFNFEAQGTKTLIVENLNTFTTLNTGALNTTANVVNAAAGSSGIP